MGILLMNLPQIILGVSEAEGKLDQPTIEGILRGNIGENIKSKVSTSLLDAIEKPIANFQETINKLRASREQIENIFQSIASESFLDEMGSYLGATLVSNYTFAMKAAIEIINAIFALLDNIPPIFEAPPDFNSTQIEEVIESFIKTIPNLSKLPDALEIATNDLANNVLANLTVGFNNSSLIMLVLVVAHIAKFKMILSDNQIEELEELLRNWAQEIMAQNELLQRRQNRPIARIRPRADFLLRNHEQDD